jgi:hypothetical protein
MHLLKRPGQLINIHMISQASSQAAAYSCISDKSFCSKIFSLCIK